MWNPFDALAKLFSSATPEQPNKAGGSPPPRSLHVFGDGDGDDDDDDEDDDEEDMFQWPELHDDDDEPVELLDDDDKPAATSMPPVLGDLSHKAFQVAVDSFLDSQESGLEKQQPRTTKNDDGEISWPDSMSNDFEYHGEEPDSIQEELAAFMQPPRLRDEPWAEGGHIEEATAGRLTSGERMDAQLAQPWNLPPEKPDRYFATADEFFDNDEYEPPARSRKHRTRKFDQPEPLQDSPEANPQPQRRRANRYDKPDSLQRSLAEFMEPPPTDVSKADEMPTTTWGQINVMDMLDAVAQADASASQDVFEPIKPPENLFEEVVESFASFVAKIARIDVPDSITSVQALLEKIFGRPKTESNAPETISEAINPLDETGPLNRTGAQGGALGKAANWAVGRAASHAASRLAAGAAGGAAGGAAAGAAGGAAAAAGLGLAAGFLTGIIGVIAALKALASQSYQTALRLAEFDGGIMGAKVQLEIGDLLRDIVKADALSEAAVENLEAENRLKQAMLPYEIWFNNMGLNVGTWAKKAGAEFLENPIGNTIEALAGPAGMLLSALGFDISDHLQGLNDKVLELIGMMPQKDLEKMLAGEGQMPLHEFLIRPPAPLPPLVAPKL